MKQKLNLLFLGFLYLLSACKNESAEQQTILVSTPVDTLDYTVERFMKIEDNCQGDTCAKIEINYLNFTTTEDNIGLNTLNKNILDGLRDKDYTNFVAYANGFLRDYALDKAEIPDMAAWQSDTKQSVLLSSPKVLCIATTFYTYTGGAHGLYGTTYKNYNPETGNIIELKDLFVEGYEEELNEIGEAFFRKDMAIDPRESFAQAGYVFDKEQFYLPDNFALKKDRILLNYGLYEIASYAQGEQEFTIPYSELKDLLRTDFPLAVAATADKE